MKYITSHDEAANRRDGATGAYFASLVKGGNDAAWPYVEGKTRSLGSLGMLSSPIYMDSPQLRMLEEGDFTHNPAIQWELRNSTSQAHVNDFFKALSKYVQSNDAFAFQNMTPDIENHIDDANKVISLKRTDQQTGKQIYALINLGDHELTNYSFGVDTPEKMSVALSSDRPQFGGADKLDQALYGQAIQPSGTGLHGKSNSVTVPYVSPYGVVILESGETK
jgi:hypothetical protein